MISSRTNTDPRKSPDRNVSTDNTRESQNGAEMVPQQKPEDAVPLNFNPIAWQHIGDPIWVYDLGRDRIVWANSKGLSFWLADSLEELQNRSFSTNSDVTNARLRDYADRIGDGEAIDAVWTLYPGDNATRIRCRCSGVPLIDERTAMLSHVIEIDCDEDVPHRTSDHAEILRNARDQLAQAEARFRTFAQAGSDWLWETDENHRFVYFSLSVQEHLEQPLQQMLGLTRQEIVERAGAEPDDDETQLKWLRHAEDLAAHKPFRDLNYAMKTKAGIARFSSISGHPTFDNTGTFLGYRGVARNISGAIEAERHARILERERDLALTANTVMNRFLATMSHELRTPLNAIIGFSEILSNEVFGPLGNTTYKGYSKDILGSARHLLSIVEDLLGLSRFDLADQPLEPECISAQELSDEVLAIAQGISLQRSVSLKSELPDPKFTLMVDRRGIKQVTLNLLSNAIKFGAPKSTVTLRIAPAAAGAEIVVQDNGPGIPEEVLDKIFEPLTSADPHRAGSGAGLGLWITKRIVAAHGGTISLDSRTGEGTTATVQLPQPESHTLTESGNPRDLAALNQR